MDTGQWTVGLFKYTLFWKTYAPKVLYGEVACSDHYVIFFIFEIFEILKID